MEGYTGLALRFLSGKYEGSEYPLKSHQEINIGRGAGFELVLIEDMVSRHHARIVTTKDKATILDMNSTNGTFVNGERVRRSPLGDGDRILVGTAILQVVPLTEESLRLFEDVQDDVASSHEEAPVVGGVSVDSQPPLALPEPAEEFAAPAPEAAFALPPSEPVAAPVAPAEESSLSYEEEYGGQPMMSGETRETPLSDLLELFGNTRKSGVLVLQTGSQEGRLHLRAGRLVSAGLNGRKQGNLVKLSLRILGWSEASFALYPPNDADIQQSMDENPSQLLRKAQRNAEKLRKFRSDIPEHASTVELCRPLLAPLRELRPDHLELIQQVFNTPSLAQLSDQSEESDVDLYQRLTFLIRSGYLHVH